jgi:sterol desaturase/sphingolipid hydroxylase (fatty acid hydroxylase superfamily)
MADYWLYSVLAAGISFLFLGIVFGPIEKLFPAKPGQVFFRPQWVLDLCFFLGQYLFWAAAILWAMDFFRGHIHGFIPASFRNAVSTQPWYLQALEVVVVSDVLIYWGHRLQHNVDFLWRFHKVHHSAVHLDWLAAHREHPLDTVYTVGLINLPAFVFGFSLEAIAGLISFRGIWAIYIHSNVRLPLGPLRLLIGAPELHHWHHDLERDAGNYANISPLMDVIFRTYTCPSEEPKKFGIKEDSPSHYLGHLLYPLLPAKISQILEQKRRAKTYLSKLRAEDKSTSKIKSILGETEYRHQKLARKEE